MTYLFRPYRWKDGDFLTEDDLKRANPSDEGVDARSIRMFVEDIEKRGIELHGMMLIKNGKAVAEGYWKPYAADTLQGCYSATKTFTASAIGLAVAEGKLSLSDKLADIFPEKLPEHPSDHLLQVTVHDLLCMASGQIAEADVSKSDDWVRSFMAQAFPHKPGTYFKYNSIGSHMLAEILYRKTGETLLEYLTPRLFEPIGIHGVLWDQTPGGIETGGWGLHVTTEHLARMGLLLLQHGRFNGKQVLPEEWVIRASSRQIDNSGEGGTQDWVLGYCYQMWISAPPHSFRLDGAFGQFSIVLPDQNAVVALHTSTERTQEVLDLVWKHLVPGFTAAGSPEDDAVLKSKLQSLSLQDCPQCPRSALEKQMQDRTIVFDANEETLKTEFERYRPSCRSWGIRSVKLVFDADTCNFVLETVNGLYRIAVGLNGNYCKSASAPDCDASRHTAAIGCWRDDYTFEFILRPLEVPQSNCVTLHFTDHAHVEMTWVDHTGSEGHMHRLCGVVS